MRHYSLMDRILGEVDHSLRTIYGRPAITERSNPAEGVEESRTMSDQERDLVGRLMRINHAGEVSAQGLYKGQALTAHRKDIADKMERAAMEENDHLAWTESRIREMGAHKSLFGPLWYWGSFGIGAVAGAVGDKWSLGFVNETEKQVVRHLEEHLEQLPDDDKRSRAILEQMKEDEEHHATAAVKYGGAPLPEPVCKVMMPMMSKVMTKLAYWI